jgi:hypothetical protein
MRSFCDGAQAMSSFDLVHIRAPICALPAIMLCVDLVMRATFRKIMRVAMR